MVIDASKRMRNTNKAIFRNGMLRIGSVAKFMGNPVKERWVGYSVRRLDPAQERRRGFATRWQAIRWVQEAYDDASV